MAAKGEKRNPSSHRTPSQVRAMDHGYEATPKMVKHREQNNEARAKLEKLSRVHKGDGKDVDHHKVPLRDGGSNKLSNLKVTTEKYNRGWRARVK